MKGSSNILVRQSPQQLVFSQKSVGMSRVEQGRQWDLCAIVNPLWSPSMKKQCEVCLGSWCSTCGLWDGGFPLRSAWHCQWFLQTQKALLQRSFFCRTCPAGAVYSHTVFMLVPGFWWTAPVKLRAFISFALVISGLAIWWSASMHPCVLRNNLTLQINMLM